MSARSRGLARLAGLYGMVERMRSTDLRVAADAVTETVQALERQREVRAAHAEQSHAALEYGDREDWLMAESQIQLDESVAARVERLRKAREAVRETALEAYRASRIRMEQMQQLVRTAREREELLARRRFQAALDERHLARAVWVRNGREAGVETDGPEDDAPGRE